MFNVKTDYPCPLDKCYWEFYNLTHESYMEFMTREHDNNYNLQFNKKLYSLIGKDKCYVLDLGCGIGEAVASILRDGHVAVGLDGMSLYKIKPVGPWADHKEYFFNCDFGKPFQVQKNGEAIQFDAVMSWECLEHIKMEDIDVVVENIANHCRQGSFFITSIGRTVDNQPTHRTLKDREWWLNKFYKVGFIEKDLGFGNDLIRREDSHYFFMVKNV